MFWAFCIGTHGFAGRPQLHFSYRNSDLFILEHTLSGPMHISRVDIFALLSESLSNPVDRQVTWLGHADKVSKLGRTVDGRGLLSKGHSGDSIAWTLLNDGKIRQRTVLPFEEACFSATLLAGKCSSTFKK
jgi:hypothetical protein